MNIMNIKKFRFGFCTLKKPFYDVIFIGAVATALAKQFNKKVQGKFTSLVINSYHQYKQPILIPISGTSIRTSDIVDRRMDNCDLRIQKVLPQSSKILYPNGTQIGYRQLVFTENHKPNYQKIQNLKQSLENPYSMVFSNNPNQDLKQLYHSTFGQIIFSVPKQRHVGYDNYLFLHFVNYIKKKNSYSKQKQLTFNVKIVLGGDKFFPYHEKLQNYFRELLKANQIEVIENTQTTKIDYPNRKITLSNGKQLTYQAYYQYLPLNSPPELQGINTVDINKHTLRNNKYDNITIFGNAELPTTHSYYGINYQINVVRQNLINSLFNSNRQYHYNGETAVHIWKNHKDIAYFQHDYEKTRRFDGYGQGNLFGKLCGLERRLQLQYEVDLYYSGSILHTGYPNYIGNPSLKQAKTHARKPTYTIDRKKIQTN